MELQINSKTIILHSCHLSSVQHPMYILGWLHSTNTICCSFRQWLWNFISFEPSSQESTLIWLQVSLKILKIHFQQKISQQVVFHASCYPYDFGLYHHAQILTVALYIYTFTPYHTRSEVTS